MADTYTILGRSKLSFPDLGNDGGLQLETDVKALFAGLSDDLNSRYSAFEAIADSATVEIDHNLGVAIEELRVLIYTGTGVDLTRVEGASLADWTIAAKAGSLKTVLQVTAPASGGPHDFVVIIAHGSFLESIDEMDDVDISTTAPEEGQALVWQTDKFIPGASGDSSLKLQSISGTDLNIKSGHIILSDGRELRLSADLAYDLSAIAVDDDYYVYIDLSLIPISPTVVSGREVYDLTDAMFTLLTSPADEVNNSQYVYIGTIQRSAGTWQNQQTGAFRRHDLSTGDVKGNTYSLTASQVDALLPLSHGLSSVPMLILQVSDGTDYEYHDVGTYFKADTSEIKSTGTTLESVFGAATPVIFSYAAGTPTVFVPNRFWNSYVASANQPVLANDKVFADSGGGTISLTLPLTPEIGDEIKVIDYDGSWSATNRVDILGNGNTIMGVATYELTIANSSVSIVFNGTEWRVY
jgi:hypothetical protein